MEGGGGVRDGGDGGEVGGRVGVAGTAGGWVGTRRTWTTLAGSRMTVKVMAAPETSSSSSTVSPIHCTSSASGGALLVGDTAVR